MMSVAVHGLHLSTLVFIWSIAAVANAANGQETNKQKTNQYSSTEDTGASVVLTTQETTSVNARSDSDIQSKLEQLLDAVKNISQRQEQESKEIATALRNIATKQEYIQANFSELERKIGEQLQVTSINSTMEQSELKEHIQRSEASLSRHLDAFQLELFNVSRDVIHLKQHHTDYQDQIMTTLRRLPAVSKVLLQQHYGGSTFFNRKWNEFKVGFGDVTDNYWIGNERLHELTKYGQYKLRVEVMLSSNQQWYWAEYSTFRVGDESTGYQLNISGYRGTTGDQLNDSNGMKFSTSDNDNDNTFYHCADDVNYGNGGGFWYNACGFIFINSPTRGSCGFVWNHTGGRSCNKLIVSRLMLLPIN